MVLIYGGRLQPGDGKERDIQNIWNGIDIATQSSCFELHHYKSSIDIVLCSSQYNGHSSMY